MPVQASVPSRSETLIDTGYEFRPGDPIRVRVVNRDRRTLVTDDGAAIEKAGRPRRWDTVAHRLAGELNVNISRHGVVSLPVVRVGPPEAEVVRRVGEAACVFYQDLLDLGE